jgi:hypothetical protein
MHYTINLQPEEAQPPKQPQTMLSNVPTDVMIERLMAETRNLNAIARVNESLILLNGMLEIRNALNIPSIDPDNQKAIGDHPPLKPMFEPDQIATLQKSYLSFSEKYLKMANHVMSQELKIGKKEEPKQE